MLTDLPAKIASVERVPMSTRQVGFRLEIEKVFSERAIVSPQAELYFQLVADYKARAAKVKTSTNLLEA